MTDPLSTEQRIGQNTEVTLHFALRLENGDTVDSTFDKAPATFKVGDGNLLPGFEAALFGFKAGDKRNLQILPENAFGQPNPQNVQIIPRSPRFWTVCSPAGRSGLRRTGGTTARSHHPGHAGHPAGRPCGQLWGGKRAHSDVGHHRGRGSSVRRRNFSSSADPSLPRLADDRARSPAARRAPQRDSSPG